MPETRPAGTVLTMIDWTHIQTALLDMDGPLLDLAFDEYFWHRALPARYAAVHGIPTEEAEDKLKSMYRSKEGQMDWYDVDYWSRQVGFDVASIKVREAAHVAVHQHTGDFLRMLKKHGIRRVLLTNAHPKTLRLKMAVTGLEKDLDEVISTFSLGVGKETPELWVRLQQKLGYDPAKTALVEDSATNLAAAKKAGIGHLIHIHGGNSARPVAPHADYLSVNDLGELI